MGRYRFLGTCDNVNHCDCCGRTNLKRTVALNNTETGEDVYFGTSCAARALKMDVKAVKAAAKSADDERKAVERAERQAAAAAETERWTNFLIKATGGINDYAGRPDIFKMIEALGGYYAARDAYSAA